MRLFHDTYCSSLNAKDYHNYVLISLLILQAKEIVLRHVVGAKVSAQDVATGPVETLGGETIELIKHHNGGIQIKGPTTSTHVILANIFATNGVIHVIDSVIL